MSRNLTWDQAAVDAAQRSKVDPRLIQVSAKRSKYGASKKELDGYRFDSVAESKRYLELRTLERVGEISELKLQPEYLLQERFRDQSGEWVRAITYRGDFEYVQAGRRITEDIKGVMTPVAALKLKMFRKLYPEIELRIVPVRRKKGNR